jgi:hypothetical protein
LECGGKRSATPLWIRLVQKPKKSKAPPLSAHSKYVELVFKLSFFSRLLSLQTLLDAGLQFLSNA